jgi:hypothetical protein
LLLSLARKSPALSAGLRVLEEGGNLSSFLENMFQL